MSRTGTSSVRRGVAAVVVAVGLVAVAPASAGADTGDPALDTLTAAARATSTAIATGVDVVTTVSFSRSTDLRSSFIPQVAAVVPARSRVRVHVTANADGSSYTSVRRQPSGRLLGGAGREASGAAPWATVSMLLDGPRGEARSAGVPDRTALTGVDPDDVRDSYILTDPFVDAARLVLPPYSRSQDEGWSTVSVTPGPGGTTVISGTIRAGVPASDGEDRCVRPLVEIVVGPDLVARTSRWIETCPGRGTREYVSVVTYGPQAIQPPTRPRVPASSVLR
jgi:hypothetical protein